MKAKHDNKPAIIYQSLFLSNLLLIPLGSFLLLIYFFYKAQSNKHQRISHFNKIHLFRTIQITLIAGLMLGVAPVFYIF